MTRWADSGHVLPDYLIIGAAKAGTSFLHKTLREHPAIRGAVGEVDFFDQHFERGLDWYRQQFPVVAWREMIIRQHGAFATGEKSPGYLYDPAVPGRVRRLLPDVKLIVLLRDPVDRAFSNFQHERRRGTERRPFDQLVAAELEWLQASRNGAEPGHRPGSYLGRGLYTEQLKHWLAVFPRSQFQMIESELMFSDPVGVVCDVQRFLGVESVAPHELRPINAGEYSPMPDAMRTRLREFYEPDVKRLRELLEDAPRWWLAG
jgi:hypothetical protein